MYSLFSIIDFLAILINSETLKYHGRIECLAERDMQSYDLEVTNNYVNELMVIRFTVYDALFRICSDSHIDPIVTIRSPSGISTNASFFKCINTPNVFLYIV